MRVADRAVGSLEAQVLVSARKLAELGVAHDELPAAPRGARAAPAAGWLAELRRGYQGTTDVVMDRGGPRD